MHENPQPHAGNGAGRGREAVFEGSRRNERSGGAATLSRERPVDDDRPWMREELARYVTELERRERWPIA